MAVKLAILSNRPQLVIFSYRLLVPTEIILSLFVRQNLNYNFLFFLPVNLDDPGPTWGHLRGYNLSVGIVHAVARF